MAIFNQSVSPLFDLNFGFFIDEYPLGMVKWWWWSKCNENNKFVVDFFLAHHDGGGGQSHRFKLVEKNNRHPYQQHSR